MPELSCDIFLVIFEELQDDPNSLYSCLFVNNLWCNLVVPILWNYPQKFCSMRSRLKRLKLFNLILSHLPESSRDLLKNEGINIIPETRENQLTFDYVKFLKFIDHNFIFNYGYYGIDLNNSQQNLLEQEVYKLLISKCSAIKHLNMDGFDYPIHEFEGARTCLSNIKEFSCKSTDETSLMSKLIQTRCNYLEKLHIILQYDDEIILSQLIGMQNQIQYLKISHKQQTPSTQDYRNIVQAIERIAPLIIHLDLLIHDGFPVSLIPKFNNLQTLIILNNIHESGNQKLSNEQLKTAVFPELRILSIKDISLSVVANIIQKTNQNLHEIQIQRYMIDYVNNNLNNSKEYIQAIYNYCPYIKNVTIFLNNENLDDFKKFLESCHYLEGVEIGIIEYGDFDEAKFLDILFNSAPINLDKLLIDNIFTLKSLEIFLGKWSNKNSLRPLHIYYDEMIDPFSYNPELTKFRESLRFKYSFVDYHDSGNFWPNPSKDMWDY
ncbi:hypothetical protein C1645_780903, partial [Glomus cerebriforme]